MTAPCKSQRRSRAQGCFPPRRAGNAPSPALPCPAPHPSPGLWNQRDAGCQAGGRRGVLAVPSPTQQEGARDRGQILVLGPHPNFPQRLHQLGWFPNSPMDGGCCGHCQQAGATAVSPQMSASPQNICITLKHLHHPKTSASFSNSIIPKHSASPPSAIIIPKYQHHP